MFRKSMWQYLLLIFTLVASEALTSKKGDSNGQKSTYINLVETTEAKSGLEKSATFSTPTGPAAVTGSFSTPTGPAAATGSFGSGSFSTPTGPAAATGSFGSFSTPTGPAKATGSFGETSVPSSFKTITSAPTTDTCYRVGEVCTKNKECCTGACAKSDDSDDDDKYCAADTDNTPTDEDAPTGSFSTPTGPAKATGSFSTPTGPAKATGSFGETSVPSSFKTVTAAPTIDSCYRVGDVCTKNRECCTGMCAKSDDSDDDNKYCAVDTDNKPTDEDAPTGSFSTPTGPAKATGAFPETSVPATPTGPAKATGAFPETSVPAGPEGTAGATGAPGTTPCGESAPEFFTDDFCPHDITNTMWTTHGGDWKMSSCKYSSLGVEGADIAWIGEADPRSILWTEYKVEARMFLNSSCTDDAGIIFRAQTVHANEESYYYIGVGEDAMLAKANYGRFETLDSQNLDKSAVGEWIVINLDLKGPLMKIKVTFEGTDTTYSLTGSDAEFDYGSVGLRTYNCPAVFDYIDVVGPRVYDSDVVEPCSNDLEGSSPATIHKKHLRDPSALVELESDKMTIDMNVIMFGSGSIAVVFLALFATARRYQRRTGYVSVPL